MVRLDRLDPAVTASAVLEPLLSAIRESKKCYPERLAKTRNDTLRMVRLDRLDPAVTAAAVPEPLLSALRESKKCYPERLAKTRNDTLQQWAVGAKALEEGEERFKSELQKVWRKPELTLWCSGL